VIRVEALPCGARLVTERMSDVRSVAIGIWVGTGSRDEDGSSAGISHFLEHLLFKGTPVWSASDIAEKVDEVGGDMNAFTSKEQTSFYIRLLSEHVDLGLDVLSSIMTDPAIRAEDVEAERQVILDEILMHADEPADVAIEQCNAGLFPGHALGREVIGKAPDIEARQAAHIRDFFERHYVAGNMVVAVAGDVDHDQVATLVEERFGGRSGSAPVARTPPVAPPESLIVNQRSSEQTHVVIGLRVMGRTSDERFPLAVLDQVLGGGVSSRMFQEIRERRGLAYSVWSEHVHYEETGSLMLAAGTSPRKASEVLKLMRGELERMAESGITDRELGLAKSHLRAQSLLSLEDSGARMSRIGASLMVHGKVPPVEEVLGKVERVTLEDVARIASRLATETKTVSIVGQFEGGGPIR
jgi:predicted Zn-dependent peptidase